MTSLNEILMDEKVMQKMQNTKAVEQSKKL